MNYQPQIPREWREEQRALADARARSERERRRLDRLRWEMIWQVTKRILFVLGFIIVVIAAVCGVTLGNLAATRRRRY